jgi:hypothetical protein
MTDGKYPLLLIAVMTGAYLAVQAITGQDAPVNLLLLLIQGVATVGIFILKPAPPPPEKIDLAQWGAQNDIDSGWAEVKRQIRGEDR